MTVRICPTCCPECHAFPSSLPVDHGAIAGAYRLVAEFENVREAS